MIYLDRDRLRCEGFFFLTERDLERDDDLKQNNQQILSCPIILFKTKTTCYVKCFVFDVDHGDDVDDYSLLTSVMQLDRL